MIHLVTGTLGSGKTTYGVWKMRAALESGKCVATNVDVAHDFPRRVAFSNPFTRLFPGRARKRAQKMERRFHRTDSLEELFGIHLEGTKEGRGVMVLDEAHGWMNSRLWNDDQRLSIIDFFTQARKLGWVVYLITQNEKNIDSQVRNLFEYHTTVLNMKRFRFAGIRVPVNFFLAITRWHAAQKSVIKRETYVLGGLRKLYNTHGLHHTRAADAAEPTLTLPRPVVSAIVGADGTDVAEIPKVYADLPEATLAAMYGSTTSPLASQSLGDLESPSAASDEPLAVAPRSGPGLVTPGFLTKMAVGPTEPPGTNGADDRGGR